MNMAGFISSTWHITSNGMFAGSCIGVIGLVCGLEFIRRLGREYDRFIIRKNPASFVRVATSSEMDQSEGRVGLTSTTGKDAATTVIGASSRSSDSQDGCHTEFASTSKERVRGRPTVVQQVIRAGLHMVQFAVAYFVMLLAMYFNGYIIICILIGAFIGAFAFSWDLGAGGSGDEVSGCCG